MTHLASASRRRTPGESRRIYAYDQNGNLLEETGGGRSPIDYVYLDGKPIAEILPVTGQVYYLHDDRLGTPQIVTDGSQNIVWGAVYQPFGAASILVGAITQNLRLPGQYFDTEVGLNHNGFRDYMPSLGRYSESDPLGIWPGPDEYSYALSNPVRFRDPLGLWGVCTKSNPTGAPNSGTTTCTGPAIVSAVGTGPHQAPYTGHTGSLYPPIAGGAMGTVAVQNNFLGIGRAGLRRYGTQIFVSFADNGAIAASGGPAGPYTVSDRGDINIQNDPSVRFDLYRWDSTHDAFQFGIKPFTGTVTFPTASGGTCPAGWTVHK